MIYTLRVECLWGAYFENECVRVIEIEEDDTLESLHLAIQKAVGFHNDHMYDFCVGRGPRTCKRIVEDDSDWDDNPCDQYAAMTLNQVYPLPKMKLYYLFDFGDNWLFEIKKERAVKEPAPGQAYPRVIEKIGPNPEQYPLVD